MSRDDLIQINSKIIEDVCEKIKENAPNSILIIVTNPLDAMVYKAWKITGFPKERVIGMAGILDTARFKAFIRQETKCSFKDINTMVLGGHGDSMVPLISHTTIKDSPLSEFLSKEKIDKLVERTRNGGAEIVSYLKTGSAYFAPARAITEMVESIVHDKKQTLPCSALCNGEYGAKDLFIGVPTILGAKGAEKIVELKLTNEEKQMMDKTIEHVKGVVESLEI